MKHFLAALLACLALGLSLNASAYSQSATGNIAGTITDQNDAVIPGVSITATNSAIGFTRSTTTDSRGNYRLSDIPTGTYMVTIDAFGFKMHARASVTLDASQTAVVNAVLEPGDIREGVTVNDNAPMLNATTAEVATRFDSRRLSELPIAPNRGVYNIVLSAAGVSQRAAGQTPFTLGISVSSNGGRIRSNSFLLDGQDMNDPALGGSQMALNNPDAIQEVRIITSQFLPEHGHNASSVVEIFGRSGTNHFHGSAFWFHNNENLNACSNTDKHAGFCNRTASNESNEKAPLRRENQFGFTLGGPVLLPRFGEGGPYLYKGTDKTFFFADHQRWSDRRTPSLTIRGAPTNAGRASLQPFAATRPHVQQLLRFIPVGIANGLPSPIVSLADGASFPVEIGDLTTSSKFDYKSDQGSVRIDHRPNERNLVYGRYRYHFESTRGAGQIAPPGHSASVAVNAHATTMVRISSSPRTTNEARIAWKRLDVARDGADTASYSIPAIEILELGLTGNTESETRTAFGLPTNLPVYRTSDTYHISDAVTLSRRNHALKIGGELRRSTEKSTLFSLERGTLTYTTLSNFVNDVALSGSQGLPLPGSDLTQRYHWAEAYFYVQDQWKVRPDLTLLYGVRYEYPGDSFQYLREVNDRVLAENNNPDFRFEPYPKADTNNWMPRVGLNWNPRTNGKGLIGFLTGGDRLVVRLGYARAYDAWAVNINQNIFTSFPFTVTRPFSGARAYERLTASTIPVLTNPRLLTHIVVPENFRSPATDHLSFDIQRELGTGLLFRIGYLRTRGTGLFQTTQGNPTVPCLFGNGIDMCNTTGIDPITGATVPVRSPGRIDPTRGIVNFRANSASSTYDALQTSLEKRISRGFSFGLHYTWSSLIDTASDFFSPSVAEGATPQDPYDWSSDRGRGSYDRPHRLSGNFVYELPFFSKQKGLAGKLLGGWQVNSFFNFQSGTPFSPLNGSDPAGVGAPIRPNVFTNLDLSGMSVAQLYQLDQQMRVQAIAQAQQIFNNLIFGPGRCISSAWLPGPPLPLTLFAAPRGRIVCDALGRRTLSVEFNGILAGQRVGNAGRNILRADSFKNVDIGIIKNTRISETVRAQVWIDFFNAFNWRNFGIPPGAISDPAFLDQWTTDGGSRRIRLGARVVF